MMIPYGICISIVTGVLKPNPWMINMPKLDIPLFGILQTMPKRKKR